jgi:hypothetical protein
MIATILRTLIVTVALGASAGAAAQPEEAPRPAPPAATQPTSETPTSDPAVAPPSAEPTQPDASSAAPSSRRDRDCFGRGRHPVVRVGQDFHVGIDDAVSDLTVILGSATVDGLVCGDMVVVLGTVTLGEAAVIEGTLVAVGGAVRAEPGAEVRKELVVVGGGLDASPSLGSRERVIIGIPVVGDRLMSVTPWLTRGLLMGRLIVPDLRGVWYVVGVVLFVLLVLNLLFPGATAAATAAIEARPLSTFAVGLLVLLLSGPFLTLLAITVIGVLAIPVVACAMVAAAFVGAIAVARWIGMRLVSQDEPTGRLQATLALAIGLVVLIVAFMIPVVGITAWALTSVLGLGAATSAFIGAFRAENPARPARQVDPGTADPLTPSTVAAPAPEGPAAARLDDLPLGAAAAAADGPSVAFTPPSTPPLPVLPRAVASSDLRLMPKATFLDRLAAIALDVLLVGLLNALLGFTNRPGSFMLLLVTYHVVLWAWKTTTVGGIICQLRIVRVDGQSLQFGDGLIRGLMAVLSFAALGLGQFWILRDPEQQAWHDKVAGTWVVKVPRDWPLP